jgi:hypothetical protein
MEHLVNEDGIWKSGDTLVVNVLDVDRSAGL